MEGEREGGREGEREGEGGRREREGGGREGEREGGRGWEGGREVGRGRGISLNSPYTCICTGFGKTFCMHKNCVNSTVQS